MNRLANLRSWTPVTISHQMAYTKKKSVNVLCLDGGGVRGLSSLIALRKLLCRINRELNPTTHNGQPLHPNEVFDLIVGTSTGGLQALMMVKFGMSVDQCIKAYKKLSKKIFKQWHVIGKFSGGFGSVKKFSSKNLKKVLLKYVIEPSLQGRDIKAGEYLMEDVASHPEIMCAVVCREIYRTTKQRTPRTIFLCTHWDVSKADSPLVCSACCRAQYDLGHRDDKVRVADAARATSAAPTFFKHVELLGTLLVDGGFGETNNPSLEAYRHYFFDPAEYESIQMVNIGTGTEEEHPVGWQPRKSKIDYVPFLRGVARTTKDLATLATESERVGRFMRESAKMSPNGVLKFDRFSANRGNIHKIRLHQYKSIPKIEQFTEEYLEDVGVSARLDRVAREIAETCRARRALLQSVPASVLHETLSVLPQAELEPLIEEQPEVMLLPEQSPSLVKNGGRLDEIHLENLVVPENAPGLTDTSDCGSLEMPPTPRKAIPRRRDLLRRRKSDD